MGKMPKRPQQHRANGWRPPVRAEDKRELSASARGYDHKWRAFRLAFLASNPLCVYCLKDNRITPATVVDHIIPHKGDKVIFWQHGNHQALCKQCHDSTKKREEANAAPTND